MIGQCRICGHQAGIINLINGKCKSCSNLKNEQKVFKETCKVYKNEHKAFEETCKDYKSALLALVSIPIAMFCINNTYAMAHGAWILIICCAPGIIGLELVGATHNWPNFLLAVIGFTAQYVGYFFVIRGIRKLAFICR